MKVEHSALDLYEAMERVRWRLEREYTRVLDSHWTMGKRLVQLEAEMVAADRALDALRKIQ